MCGGPGSNKFKIRLLAVGRFHLRFNMRYYIFGANLNTAQYIIFILVDSFASFRRLVSYIKSTPIQDIAPGRSKKKNMLLSKFQFINIIKT